jgi:hypothetical protein
MVGTGMAFLITFTVAEFLFASIFKATLKFQIPMIPAMTVVFTIILIAFPFFSETKNDINAFFVTQNIPRKTIVSGTYLYALLSNLLYTAVVFIIEIAVALTADLSSLKIRLIVAGVMFLMMELGVAVNYPIYFKRGIANGIVTATLVSFIIPCVLGIILGVLSLYRIIDFSKIQDTRSILILFGAALFITGILNFLSISLSKKNYAGRDL